MLKDAKSLLDLLCLFAQYKFHVTGKNWICFAFYIYFVMQTNVSNISGKLFLQNFFRAICLFLHFIPKVAKKSPFFRNFPVDCTKLKGSNTQVILLIRFDG